ncbi:Predicted NTP pyrophosphohydrolase, NUDIX family [Devosia sp. YR412]|uniref:NUDIX hydrolase n=1 Tax=Devosia sp. YR412 TaxID=1881030 RepID=UPI0008BD2AD1|nr:NUDIX hydrolase [Devosia sp. YR412]SEQ00300.1 Predicted NTP pyrophosphohydrolase, NUDIX family [Devosia sp. YR412]
MLRDLLRLWSPSVEPVPSLRQSGALPYTVIDGRVVFLLVTSRRTGRWIFPKGSIIAGMTPWDSAAKEAMEEAGVTGQIGSEPIGSYQNSDKGALVDIDVYPLRVDVQHETWDEMDQRLRHWVLLAEARRLLADRTLVEIAETLHRRLTMRLFIQ